MKSKYQSALGIGNVLSSGPRAAAGDLRPHAAARIVVERAPRGDLVDRSQAPDAQPGRAVDPADVDARRGDAWFGKGRGRAHLIALRAHAGSGSFASSARATRETGARPRKSEMYLPARRSFSMSTPVSMSSPCSRYS